MGRVQDNLDSLGNQIGSIGPGISASELDLVRFIGPGNRLFDGNLMAPKPSFFLLDGGTTTVADWAIASSADFRSAGNSLTSADNSLTPKDPFNDVGFAGNILAKLTTADIQLMEALGFQVGATAAMVLRRGSDFESYGIRSNGILASSQLGAVGTDWQFVTLGGFNDSSTTSDMLLRNSTSGGFQVYNISNNQITGSASIGTVGLNWQFSGVGNFSSKPGESGMILRNTDIGTGDFWVYNISNNQITSDADIGAVGLNWQFSGIGNFSGKPGASDMLLRNSTDGAFRVYNINNNQITDSASIGTVGLNWQFSGVGNFSSKPGESDMILRNTNTGELLVYNISNNQITGTTSLGTVGPEWQFAGVAPIRVPGASDLVLRNVNTGQFQVYNIADNQITGSAPLGTVGLDWQLGGFAPTASNGFIGTGLRPSALSWLNLSAGTGNGRVRRQQRRARRFEYRPPQYRHVTADISDDAAALLKR